jgi:hypothetical protein
MPEWIDQHQTTFGLVVLLFIWCFVCALLSYISGWTALAQRYQWHSAFAGDRWSFQSGQMRWRVDYGSCLTVGIKPPGALPCRDASFSFRNASIANSMGRSYSLALEAPFLQRVRLELGRELHIPY